MKNNDNLKIKNQNRGAKRSRNLIRKAFAELVEEKQDLNKITVTEIVLKADISKSTFYAHYEDIYDLIDEFGEEIINTLNETINTYIKNSSPTDEFMPYINNMLNLLKENEELYKKLFALENQINFIDKIKEIIINRLTKDTSIKFNIKNKDLLYTALDFITNGLVYLVCDYFKGRLKISLDEIANLTNEFLKKIFDYESKIN